MKNFRKHITKKMLIEYWGIIFGPIVRFIIPSSSYLLLKKNKRTLKPISTKYGFDRGTPIDRYWIEDFLYKNRNHIQGHCLEITDDHYVSKFGGNVTKVDVLDIDKNNKLANIYGDLRNLKDVIPNNTYDCTILTHVLGLIDEYENVIKETYRILKPGGVMLFTSSTFSPVYDEAVNYWRFTPASIGYIFGKYFKEKNIHIKSYGNVLAGQAFWVGMAQEDLTKRELEYNDSRFPCIVTARIKKEGKQNGKK